MTIDEMRFLLDLVRLLGSEKACRVARVFLPERPAGSDPDAIATFCELIERAMNGQD